MTRTAIPIAGSEGYLPGNITGPDELWAKLCEAANARAAMPIQRWDDTTPYDSTGNNGADLRGEPFEAGNPEKNESAPLPARQMIISPEKAYLVTEGASILGIELAKWLVDNGAMKLVLISRAGARSEYDKNAIRELVSRGVTVDCEFLDITHSQAVINCIGKIRLHAPIGGVIHSAAVLRDISVPCMTEKVFDAVFNPRVAGAWNLHLALDDESVDFFLNISTISCIFGNSGQPIHSSANKLLDDFVGHRRHKGLNAQRVNLGVLGQCNQENRLYVLESQGWVPLSLEQLRTKIKQAIIDGTTNQVRLNMDLTKELETA